MNTILLVIWLKILIITCLCVYYNNMVLNKFLDSHKPVQSQPNILCTYDNIQTVELSSLQKCKSIAGIQTFVYTADNVKYEISETQNFYIKACSGFCIEGLTNTNSCKLPSNQTEFEKCETLLQPKQGCLSPAKPLVNVKSGNATSYYYAVSPINSLNSCS